MSAFSSPDGLVATSVTDIGWDGTLPCPWPIGEGYLLGQGFASALLVSPVEGYGVSGEIGIPHVGNPSEGVPSLLSIDGVPLAPSSWESTVGVANVEHVVSAGAAVTIGGAGFDFPQLNLFSSVGNCGPLVPVGWSADTFTVVVPFSCPTGPASFQVVNAPTSRASNAVAAVLGEILSIDSVLVTGADVDVTGTGFSDLTVGNLFARSIASGDVENFGGFEEFGLPRLPLTVSSDGALEFTVPADAMSGPALLHLLNPPFIPFSSSGVGPAGEFTIP